MNNFIRAKFVCNSVENFVGGQNVKFSAVIGNSEENKSFSKFTPSANLQMQITAEGAIDKFQPGKEYYLDFIEA